ncbi:MAG: chromate transporter [Clostridia bacterium]|nr:chromate transporter [Clostridia bacterium]
MNKLVELFFTFSRIGALTFGGGYAMLPMLQREVVEKKSWATEAELMDWYAVGQCTPGVIAVNTATFVGRKEKGTLGALFATAGVVFPSFVIILLIAALLTGFADNIYVKSAFAGIRVCVCVLILNAVIKLSKKAVTDAFTLIILLAVWVASFFLKASPVLTVVISAALGVLIQSFKRRRGK